MTGGEQPAPDGHPNCGSEAQDHGKDRNDRGVEDQSTQDRGERRGEEHGEGNPPKTPGNQTQSLYERAPARGQGGTRPSVSGRKAGEHARQEGQIRLAVYRKADESHEAMARISPTIRNCFGIVQIFAIKRKTPMPQTRTATAAASTMSLRPLRQFRLMQTDRPRWPIHTACSRSVRPPASWTPRGGPPRPWHPSSRRRIPRGRS
jgi:hypothetical protein